jgi:hypothetical protein
MTADDNDANKVVLFPSSEPSENEEERARRLKVEVERLARLPTVEWLFYIASAGYAERFGVDGATLKRMIEAVIKEIEKARRDEAALLQRREKQAEQARSRAEQQTHRDAERREKAADKAAAKAEKAAQGKLEAFASIVELPSAMHDARLEALAKRLGEDLKTLSAEFTAFADSVESRGARDVEPWPEPVDTKALLEEILAQLRCYLVMREEEFLAMALWIMFAWIHRIVTYSPLLAFPSPTANTGKTTACGLLGFLTPRAYAGGELTGPSLFRFVDRVKPTLIIDDADRLFVRRPDLGHVVNISWTRGTLIPRVVQGTTVWFNPFCPKVLAGKKLQLADTTATRTINIKLKRKLSSEKVEHFDHDDNEAFYTLRRKATRWAVDNAVVLRKARPVSPAGFDNRLADNWRILFAIADLAGSEYPGRAHTAAIKLSGHPEQGEEIRLLSALREMILEGKVKVLTSAAIVEHLTADPTSEWYSFRGRGPITQRQVAVLLRDFDITPVVLHPTKRKTKSVRGYRPEQFDDAFERYLPKWEPKPKPELEPKLEPKPEPELKPKPEPKSKRKPKPK